MINDLQTSFLQSYQSNQGDIRGTLKECNLELNHYRLWMQNDEFQQNFNMIQSDINAQLMADSKAQMIKILKNLIENGYEEIVTETTRTTTTCKNGKTSIKKTQKSKTNRKPFPIQMVKDLLVANSFENSLQSLCDKGIIPRSVARKILVTANDYQNKLQECFGVDDDEGMNDEKAITLVKMALLGRVENVE